MAATVKLNPEFQDSPMTPEEAKHLRERWAYLEKRDKVLTDLEVWLEEEYQRWLPRTLTDDVAFGRCGTINYIKKKMKTL